MFYTLKLIKKEEVAVGTMAFYFAKPEGFIYQAGQFGEWTLIDPSETDAEGNTRIFSLITSPQEDIIGFATRLRDTAFKRVLNSLPLGAEIKMDAPHGSLTLHNDQKRPAVFLAGGIGITPFYSISLNASEERLPHKIFLFHSNRRPEDTPFLNELQLLQTKNPNYKYIPTMTETDKSALKWKGETGYINKEMLQRYLEDLNSPIYYQAGPPAFVIAMRQMLNGAGINDDYIRAEEFSGY